jgi:hypothetical protein
LVFQTASSPICDSFARLFLAAGPIAHQDKDKEIKQKTRLHIKKEHLTEQEIRIQRALAKARKAARENDSGPMKRRSNDFLAQYVGLPIHSAVAIRPEWQYRARSYNRGRQVFGLIDHLFVRYRVPLYLYRSMLSFEGLDLVFGIKYEPKKRERAHPPEARYRDWFLAAAQGASFARVSRDVFTKKEAHWFLQAPATNTIEQNILWAKGMTAGLSREACAYLVERLDTEFLRTLGDRLGDLLRFYAEEWPHMGDYDREEITDFIRAAILIPEFSLKGRTFGSMRKLSHAWHRSVHVGSVRDYRTWSPVFAPWEHVQPKSVLLIRARELTNNRALAEEGRKQHHCVYSYTTRCIHGQSRIVSFRWYEVEPGGCEVREELTRITAEVVPSHNAITQIRGRQNRQATDQEMKIIRIWAGVNGVGISPYA